MAGAGSAASLRFPTIVAPADYGPFIAHARADEAGSAPLLWAYAAVSCYYQINYALTDVPQVLDSRVGTRGNRHGL